MPCSNLGCLPGDRDLFLKAERGIFFSKRNPAAILLKHGQGSVGALSNTTVQWPVFGGPNTSLSEGIQLCISCLPQKCSGLQFEAIGVWGRKLFLWRFSTCMKLKGLIGLKRQSKCTPHCLLIRLRCFPGRGKSCHLFLFCHLLLCFSLNRSKDPWKWSFSSEVDVLPASYWVKRWGNPPPLPRRKGKCPFWGIRPVTSPNGFCCTCELLTKTSNFMILTGLRHEKSAELFSPANSRRPLSIPKITST